MLELWNGIGNDSIYGEAFEDESFEFKHNEKYLLSDGGPSSFIRPISHPPSLTHSGTCSRWRARAHVPHRNGSQFFITTKATTQSLGGATISHFDYRHVVFGRVASRHGVAVVDKIQKLPADTKHGHRLFDAVVDD
ncbi:hypothetical protein EMIHUDRAFT_198504 [Emiliania huxleyi CCMP1516]|uniref:PPIase cyclophilin-type domain-containing protein n=2 Tax=Emiliania huxleyi TaxID=2903 RepID=A0A0D3I7E4_EMIH1|nr:hypothetical protein EMIHUDRAFT_198504 [Emiliania huxleyi CCMP1516]EOD07179.1 hypothetical protein EMIHUDRAFT_198504 [Emiliania huxleyi CCMP1516]|eukprot:XP_005759608.1 hypothetical protein EMIHUDRAFT_198504 [Emiliania huxleyi CCMP1516]